MRAFIQKRAQLLAILALMGLCLPWLSSWTSEEGGTGAWIVDLATHWQWLYWAGLVVFGALAVWADRRWVLLALALPLPWITASPAAPWANAPTGTISVLSANLHLDTTDPEPLRKRLAQFSPDVVVLLELSRSYAAGLQDFSEYPHRVLAPEDGPFGIGVLSRHPLRHSAVQRDEEGIPHVILDVMHEGQLVRLAAVHPMPPISAAYRQKRDVRLLQVAEDMAQEGVPSIIAGDFNTTPWSSAFLALDMKGFRRAGGLEGTWPATLGPAGLPMDQVLVNEYWEVGSHEVLDGIGADHRAVLTSLQLRSR